MFFVKGIVTERGCESRPRVSVVGEGAFKEREVTEHDTITVNGTVRDLSGYSVTLTSSDRLYVPSSCALGAKLREAELVV